MAVQYYTPGFHRRAPSHAQSLRRNGGRGNWFIRTPLSDGSDQLRLAHGVRKYPGSLGVDSILCDKVFGYLNSALFELTGNVNVATLDQHKITLEADPTLTVIPVRADATAHTETIKARKTAFIPFSLVPLLMEKRLQPREAFLIVEAHLASQGVIDACGPLLDFLRAAGTKATGGVILNSLSEPGPSFRAEKGVTKYMRKKVLMRDLPIYSSATSRPDAATAALTSAVASLTDHQVRADETNRQKKDEDDRDKTIPEAFGALSTRKLLTLCRKTVDAELPILYLRLANKKKREDLLTIVQQNIEEAAKPLGAPVVTVEELELTFALWGE